MSPSTYAAIRSQSLSAQPEVKQPPLPGIFCFSPSSANSQAISVTSSADQTPANVNTNLLLESILHAIQDLNFNQTQAPALNDNPTQALSDDKQSGIDAFVTNSLTSGQYSAVPEIIPEDTQPNTDNTDLVYHSTPAVNNSQNTELLIDPDTNFNMVHDVPNLAPSSTTPKGDKAVVSNHRQVSRTAPVASSSPDSIRDPSFQDSVRDPSSQAHPKEPEAVHTSGISTTGIIQGELDVPLNDSLLYTTQDGEATPLAPVSAQQGTLPQTTAQTKEFQPKPRDLTVTATVNGQKIKLLVDTGAGISVIDETFLRELYANQLPALCTSSTTQVKTVSGQSLPIKGTLKVSLQIAGGTYPCDFHVVRNLSYEAVLGRDFLRAHGAVINLKNSTLHLDNEPPDTLSETTCVVRAWSTCVIPPQSESVMPAYLDANWSPGVVGLLEASPRLIERYQLQGAAALVTLSPDHTVPFRLINPTQKPVTLYRGATLGNFSRADDNIQVYSLEEQPEKPDVQPPPAENVPVDLTDADLTDTQKAELQNLLNEYRDIFALKPNELGRTNLVQHHIDTGDHAPIRQRAYRVPAAQKERIEHCIDEMLEQGVIRPSTSAWSSPVVLIKKPDGSDRFCCDLRKVNSVTKKDSYPLPRIADTLDALSGAQFFSSIDLMAGYWQIELTEQSREKTAFVTHAGLFEFNVMAFGLCNAPSCFQRLMECVLRGLNWKIALIYLDDVLVYSRTFEDHLQHLRLVFQRFREANLKLKPKKCHFGQRKVKYLGHVISREGIQPDPEKISAIKEYPVPRSVKDVRAFLGLANYYRKFVKDFAKIAGPLHDLTKKGLKFQWNEDCQSAFERLIQALTQAPILAYPDFAVEFTLATDASDEGLGYVLGQVQNGKEVVIGYAGRKLLPAEKNYSVTEREALALVSGIRHFRSYLYGVHFKVYTDHSAVRWLMQLKEPSGRLARWALLLQQYDFEIIHRAGLNNGNADALSRRPYDPVIAALNTTGVQIDRVRELQRKDSSLAGIIEYLEWETLPANNKAAKTILHTIEQYYLDPDGLLCHIFFPGSNRVQIPKSQLVIPAALRHEVLLQVHDIPFSGHLGVNKTYAKLRDRYFWPKMYMDVQHYVLSCESCAMKKTPKQRTTTPLLPLPVTGPGDRWAVDCVGPFVESTQKNRYVVVFTEYCTRWVECFAVPNIEARTIADLLVKEIMPRHGAPRNLLSDRGSNFLSSLVKEICFLMNTHKIFTTSYRPQTDGLCEKYNGTLAQCISMYVDANQKNWDEHLNAIQFAYRTAPSDVLGESPFFMMYGRDAALPCDPALLPPREMSSSVAEHRARVVENIEIARRIAAENTQRAQQKMKDLHDRFATPTRFQLGDRVWAYTPRNRRGLSKKLCHNWHGPYRIVEFLSPVHCILRAVDNSRVSSTVHVTRLKRYIDPADRPTRQPLTDVDEPFLADSDLPPDSFASESESLDQPTTESQTHELPATRQSETTHPQQRSPCADLATPASKASSPAPEHPITDESDNDAQIQTDNDVYQAEKIVRHRMRNGQPQFLVKWAGFPDSHNTWEPREHLLDQRLLKRYFKENPRALRAVENDPDFNPRVASLSWSLGTKDSPVIAAISLEEERDPPLRAVELTSRHFQPLTTLQPRYVLMPETSTPDRELRSADVMVQSHEVLHTLDHEKSPGPDSTPGPSISQPLTSQIADQTIITSFPIMTHRPPRSQAQFQKHGIIRFATWLWLSLIILTHIHLVDANEFDAAGQAIGLYPTAMMLSTNPKALVFYQETRMVSLHMSLRGSPKLNSPIHNNSCDPVLAKFYEHVLSSIRSVQRVTTRLFSIQGVTNLLECDSYLRRFYNYISGFDSTLSCASRYYADSLAKCKQWAFDSCKVQTPQEREWLKARHKRSSYWCHAGLAGIPRFFYTLGGGKCENSGFTNLLSVLRNFASTMTHAHSLTKVLNGKIIYLVRASDSMNSKLTQVINSLHRISGAFTGWKEQFNSFAKKEHCHFNMQQEFVALYSMEINRALISLLRLTEVDDLVRQLGHITQRNVIGFADLPRFLTEEIALKLSSDSSLNQAINALKNGLSLMFNPLVDIQFPSAKQLQLHLLFTLPVITSSQAVCTIQQLVPVTYRVDKKCYSGTIPRHDLLLIICGDKRFVIKSTELAHCKQNSETILCPRDLLDTVDSPVWLGEKWSPKSKISFHHAHSPVPNCNNLRTMVHLGSRFYLAADHTKISIRRGNGTSLFSVLPLHVYNFPCDYSFYSQSAGLAECAKHLSFQFPVFHDNKFHFVPWQTVPLLNSSLLPNPNFKIPHSLVLDNSTLKSLDETYATIDKDFTQRLQKLQNQINTVHEVYDFNSFEILLYLSLAFAGCNFVIVWLIYCVLSKRLSNSIGFPRNPPPPVERIARTEDQSTATSV